MAPFWEDGKRHRSKLFSDTGLSIMFAVTIIVAAGVWESVHPPAPQFLVTLVGVAGGALFGAVSRDRRKRQEEIAQTADRAESTADRAEHPDATRATGLPEPEREER